MVEINPKRLNGNWRAGYALDVHTTASKFLGHDEYGHGQFENTYSPIGQLLHELKYNEQHSALTGLVETAYDFIFKRWKLKCDIIVPVPPSNTARKTQPVMQIAQALAKKLQWEYRPDCLAKRKKGSDQLKDVHDPRARARLLEGVFHAKVGALKGKAVLLVDDLYRSGSTLSAITKTLFNDGKAAGVFVLTMTRTRTRR